jgi:hypothetical protein
VSNSVLLLEIFFVGAPADGNISLLFRYKFVIAFENSNSPGYLTEKFWGPLVVGAIPSRENWFERF